jgi:hypothetical protein
MFKREKKTIRVLRGNILFVKEILWNTLRVESKLHDAMTLHNISSHSSLCTPNFPSNALKMKNTADSSRNLRDCLVRFSWAMCGMAE